MSCVYVCSSCRRRLLRSRSTGLISQWSSKATSASQPSRESIHVKTRDSEPRKTLPRPPPPLPNARLLQSSSLQFLTKDGDSPDQNLNLSSVSPEEVDKWEETSSKSFSEKEVDKFDKLCNPNTPTLEAWELLQSLPKHAARTKLAKLSVNVVFRKVLDTWSAGGFKDCKLSPVNAFKELWIRGFYVTIDHWRQLLECTVREAIRHFDKDSQQDDEYSLSPPRANQELLEAWNLALSFHGSLVPLDQEKPKDVSTPDWSSLKLPEILQPSVTTNQRHGHVQHNLDTTFRHCFPIGSARSVPGVISLFLASYMAFKERCQRLDTSIEEVRSYRPFLDYADRFIAHSGQVIRLARHEQHLMAIPGYPTDSVKDIFRQLLSGALKPAFRLLDHKDSRSKPKLTQSKQIKAPETEKGLANLQATLDKAVSKVNVQAIETVWQMVHTKIGSEGKAAPAELYSSLIKAFSSVSRPNRAVDVWNEMIKSGHTPPLRVWDSLLKGFGAVRDIEGVEHIWSLLVRSGLELDARVWATRISSLKSNSRTSRPFEAFEEMLNNWLTVAAKSTRSNMHYSDWQDYKRSSRNATFLRTMTDLKNAPKPTVEVLNAVVPTISGPRKEKHLGYVFSSAAALGIKPDIYTFNAIVRTAIKDGDTQLMSRAIGHMQLLQVKMDIATYTMFLQAVFKEYDRDVSEEADPNEDNWKKMKAVTKILEEIEFSGLQANAYTFSTVISGLLKTSTSDESNLQAAESVVAHMRDKQIPLSSQIYTSFITAHFTREPRPPHIDAVMETWKDAAADKTVSLDDIFYDRLVEGFAKCDDIQKMRMSLSAAGRNRRVPGWIALTEAIKALARSGDLLGVQEIIEDVKKEEQDLDRLRKGKGKKWFWDTARELGFGDYHESASASASPSVDTA